MLCSAFIVGELLQAIAHETEWIIDIFLNYEDYPKFIYIKISGSKKNEHKRKKVVFEKLKFSDEDQKIFNKEYSNWLSLVGNKKAGQF